MKKIFSMAALFAAGLLGFTSCSNDDVAQGGAFSQDALAVSFAAVKTDGAVTPAKGPLLSRAAGVTTTSLTNIYVQATNSENAVYFGDGTPELFTYDGSSEFRSTTNHYWPNNTAEGANNTLNFYASNQQEALIAGTETNPSPIVDDYECDGIKDWVTATVKAGEKTIPYPLTFQHVLSQIKISAEAKDKTQDLVYKVVGVKLSAPDTGDYQFANATAGVGTWTIDNSSSANYTYEQNMNGQFNPTAATEAEQTWASTDYFNILPVTSGTLTFDVQYQVIQNGQVIGDFTGANSKQVTVDAPNLLSGKIYTYNFVLAINSNDVITFTVSTNSWTDGSTTDVQVPKTGFSVSATKKVKFSSGNLQATTTDLGKHWMWKFAENQWDCVGNTAANTSINGNKTVSKNGTVDLFGWSTVSTYLGIHNSIDSDTYSGNFVDWGSHPDVIDAVGSGWRTLSNNEWNYLLNTRTVNGGSGIGYSYTVGKEVNGVLGLVIYPDDYTGSSYNGTNWSSFEDEGCIFLPAAGERINGTTINKLNQKGLYWASDSGIEEFSSYGEGAGYFSAYVGNSVRLVRNIE